MGTVYPYHATTKNLELFLNVDVKKVPSSFKFFCSKAKMSVGASSNENDEYPPIDFRGAKCHIIIAPNEPVSFDLIHQHDPTFQGAVLTIVKLNNVCYLLIKLFMQLHT